MVQNIVLHFTMVQDILLHFTMVHSQDFKTFKRPLHFLQSEHVLHRLTYLEGWWN